MRCDSHVHIVGSTERYPQVRSRTYLADLATLDELKRRGATRGVTRFVIVQASFYGSDNTLLLESLDALGSNGRGVVVIDPAKPPTALADYARRGVRGLRLNLYTPASRDAGHALDAVFAQLETVAKDMRWHVEVIASLELLARHADLLTGAAVPVVIDHYGVYGESTPESVEGRRLLELLRRPHVWMKLSAPYRVNADPLATRPDKRWLGAILAVAAERCVWGSDWPHTPPHPECKGPDVPGRYRALSYERLVDDFLAALPATALADAILRDNPARLYEF